MFCFIFDLLIPFFHWYFLFDMSGFDGVVSKFVFEFVICTLKHVL